jgi:hypothetical protein
MEVLHGAFEYDINVDLEAEIERHVRGSATPQMNHENSFNQST